MADRLGMGVVCPLDGLATKVSSTMNDEQKAVLAAVWRAGSKDYRDTDGATLQDELNYQGLSLGDDRLERIMRALRADGFLEMYVGGDGRLANVRLSPRGRARAEELPEAGGHGGLEPDQERLLVDMVEAANGVPRPEQTWRLGGENLGNGVMGGPWGQRRVLPADVHALEKAGLLTATRRNYVYGNDYVLTPAARSHYASVKRRTSEPVQRQEESVRSLLESDVLKAAAPVAYEKWAEAERLLWSANSSNELSTIGHKLREALQDFATALVETHGPAVVNTDPTKTLDRLSAVIKQHHPGLGERQRRLFDALFEYWRVTIELIQRQEHGGQKEGEPLEWEDGRRAVLQTAVVMFEVVNALKKSTPT
jgi:hypothetical protein